MARYAEKMTQEIADYIRKLMLRASTVSEVHAAINERFDLGVSRATVGRWMTNPLPRDSRVGVVIHHWVQAPEQNRLAEEVLDVHSTMATRIKLGVDGPFNTPDMQLAAYREYMRAVPWVIAAVKAVNEARMGKLLLERAEQQLQDEVSGGGFEAMLEQAANGSVEAEVVSDG